MDQTVYPTGTDCEWAAVLCLFCVGSHLHLWDCCYSLETLQRCLTALSGVMCCMVLENISLEIWHFSFTQLWGFFSCFLNGSLSSRGLALVASEQRYHCLCCFSLITATISPVLFASLDVMWCCRCFWNVCGNACTIWKGGVKSSVSRQGFN